MIRHSRPDITEADIEAVTEVLRSGDVSSGAAITGLEAELATLMGTKFALTFNSWTSAAYALLSTIAEKNPGAEVIVPSFSFSATANVVVNAGLTPVFADVHETDGSLRFEAVRERLTVKVVAVMTVHYAGIFGQDSSAIRDLCEERDILFLEDAAEALGAKSQNGIMAGSLGIGIFSFFATKNISSGEGGALTFDSERLYKDLRLVRGHGVERNMSHPWERNAMVPGHNFRLSNINAALGLSQLRRLGEMTEKRVFVANEYIRRLGGVPWIKILGISTQQHNCWQMFPILVEGNRNQIVYGMVEAGIEASVHFDPPIHMQTTYKKRGPNMDVLETTEVLSGSVITLPMHPNLSSSAVETITEKLLELGSGPGI